MKRLGKKGLGTSILTTIIIALVLVTVLFFVAAELVPEAQSAGDALNASGVPLGGLFAGDGVIFVIIMAAILLVVVLAFLKSKGMGFGGKGR